jgi:pyruvate dehydrogenase E2 component (dihydrolipoamide acetyltransferase)
MTDGRELTMPKLGLTMTEGVVAEWLRQPGDRFRAGDVVVIVETDKIGNDVEAPADGELLEILVSVGDTALVGDPLARWSLEGGLASPSPERPRQTQAPACQKEEAAGVSVASSTAATVSERIIATPLARRLALELGLSLDVIRGSGPYGRIKAVDVEGANTRLPVVDTPAPPPYAVAEPPTGPARAWSRPTRQQAAMARRMAAAKRDIPHFYLATEAEVSKLLVLKEQLATDRLKKARPTLTAFVTLAFAKTLREFPDARRLWVDDGIVGPGGVDVGIAIHTERGLYAPVLKDVGDLGFRVLSERLAELTARARAGALTPDDLTGGVATISNGGMFDVTYMTPIINHGQSSILGVGSVRKIFRPDAAGNPELRREMGLVLSCDHRIFDGVFGLRILNTMREYIEDPMLLFL